MTNWKTTLIGLLTAIAVGVQPIVETGVIDWKRIGLAALIAALGYVAGDAKKPTSTTQTTPTTTTP
jgi:hypothetical protein